MPLRSELGPQAGLSIWPGLYLPHTWAPFPVPRGRLTTLILESSLCRGSPTSPSVPRLQALARQRTGEQAPGDSRSAEAPGRSGRPTFTNILLPWATRPGRVGVQYTDMDFRSRENSRVNSFCISCLMTCGARAGQGLRGRVRDSGCFLTSCSAREEPLAPCMVVNPSSSNPDIQGLRLPLQPQKCPRVAIS